MTTVEDAVAAWMEHLGWDPTDRDEWGSFGTPRYRFDDRLIAVHVSWHRRRSQTAGDTGVDGATFRQLFAETVRDEIPVHIVFGHREENEVVSVEVGRTRHDLNPGVSFGNGGMCFYRPRDWTHHGLLASLTDGKYADLDPGPFATRNDTPEPEQLTMDAAGEVVETALLPQMTTPAELARYMHVSVGVIYRAIKDGSLPAHQSGPGGRYIIRVDEALRWSRRFGR